MRNDRTSPRPWKVIYDYTPGKHFDGTPAEDAIKADSLRIVDSDGRLLVRIQADSEQALKGEDMYLIVEAVNALHGE